MRILKNQVLVVLLSAAFIIPLSGCKREGCTDSRAINHDTKAKKDDGSCTYTTVIFRTNYTDQGLGISMGTTTLKLDGATIGTAAPNSSFSYALRDGNTHTWNAESTFISGGGFPDIAVERSGTLAASPTQTSITIDVWE